MIDIIDERPEHAAAIEKLLDSAFGPKRKRKISYRFRQRLPPVAGLCLVAEDQGRLVGTIRHWPIVIDAADTQSTALLLGPIAVAADYRLLGIGAQLIRQGLALAAAAGYRLVVLVGEPGYYRQFGFKPASEFGIVMPMEKPARVQALVLSDDAMAISGGVIRHVAAGRPASQRSAA